MQLASSQSPRLSFGQLNGSGSAASASASDNDNDNEHQQASSLRLLKIPRAAPSIENYGFHLTRSKWDPYPWICEVAGGTPAALCGLKAGDCVLEVNGFDIVGLRVADVSKLVKSQKDCVELLLWNSGCEMDCDKNSICCAPMPTSLKRLSIVVQSILSLIECPVCMDTITPPAMQCQNGHLLCVDCRIRAEKCPVCRECYTPKRALIAEQIYVAIANAFELCRAENKLRYKLFSSANTSTSTTTAGTSGTTKSNGHCQTTGRLRQRKPLLPTNKFLTKLLQARTYSLENLSQSNAAMLLRTSSTDSFNLIATADPPQPNVKRQETTTTTTTTTMPTPNNVSQLNGTARHLSLSTNDLQQSPVEPEEPKDKALLASQTSQPASLPNNNNNNLSKSNSLLFAGKCRPAASKSRRQSCLSFAGEPSSVNELSSGEPPDTPKSKPKPKPKPKPATLLYCCPAAPAVEEQQELENCCCKAAFRVL